MTLEIKTTQEISEYNRFDPKDKLMDKKWVSVESLYHLDIYRVLCSRYGRAKVWKCSADELCELVEDYLQKELGGLE